jgi:hypothetical protein
MYYIAHKGNLNGRIPERENKPDYILEAINAGYDCQIDIWLIDDLLYLGYDKPETSIQFEFLLENKKYLWINCKNKDALYKLIKCDMNCFFINKDKYTLTSKMIIWGNINSEIGNCICFMPELFNIRLTDLDLLKCQGICSDYIEQYYKYFV